MRWKEAVASREEERTKTGRGRMASRRRKESSSPGGGDPGYAGQRRMQSRRKEWATGSRRGCKNNWHENSSEAIIKGRRRVTGRGARITKWRGILGAVRAGASGRNPLSRRQHWPWPVLDRGPLSR